MNILYRHHNENEDKNSARNEQTTKHEESLDTSLAKNENKFSDANSKSCLQTQHDLPL